MSRQQKRAIERRKGKTAFQKICLAAGEGVGKAVAFSFALASHAVAAEPKKEEPIALPPVVVQDQATPYVPPKSSLSKIPRAAARHAAIDHHHSAEARSKNRPATTLRDALRNVPGISIAAGRRRRRPRRRFTLRGFNARNDMYLDGVRDSGSYFRDSFQFRFRRSPEGTLFDSTSVGAPPAASSTR